MELINSIRGLNIIAVLFILGLDLTIGQFMATCNRYKKFDRASLL